MQNVFVDLLLPSVTLSPLEDLKLTDTTGVGMVCPISEEKCVPVAPGGDQGTVGKLLDETDEEEEEEEEE